MAERSSGMEIRKPSIKNIPYNEWKDNETLEALINELNENGVNLIVGNLDSLINWGRRIEDRKSVV